MLYGIVHEVLGYIQQPLLTLRRRALNQHLSRNFTPTALASYSSHPTPTSTSYFLFLAHACPTYPAPSTSDPIASNTIMDLESR
jgi:hypothetical protein